MKKDLEKTNGRMRNLIIATAGSVDDGKSTLIGRLLWDTQSLPDDKIAAIKKASKARGLDHLDFSFATDGLLAEREQGITIDVAHIYFSTKAKSYVIADTPGHLEYTRNMVTGASSSQAAIILVDARKGVIEQTYRHFFITNLLRIKEVVVAINKMDLVEYSQSIYEDIKRDFEALIQKQDYKEQRITFIPISALKGDNVVKRSTKMDWFEGPTLLAHLEELDLSDVYNTGMPRFPVQCVIRPKSESFPDFRAYAGRLYGGDFHVGDEVEVLPSRQKTKIKDIYFYDTKYDVAARRTSITLALEDELDIGRGDMIVKVGDLPDIKKELNAFVCWMDEEALKPGMKYHLQHGVNSVLAKVEEIHHRILTDYSGVESVEQLEMNDIAELSLTLNRPIFSDPFKDHRTNGSFILVDTKTNNTVGVGFIK